MRTLVTGGGGFLGEALVRSLLARGEEVAFLARGRYPALEEAGAKGIVADLRDPAAVSAACAGVDVVFHAAAKAGGWGRREEFESINVGGTDNVIAACRQRGVRALVYTSTPSVVHDGEAIEGGDESLPYARRFLAHYPRTKAEAERRVRAANGEGLRTVSLRPHFIWGPGDRHLLPRLLDRARSGRLRRVGAGDPLVDTTYVDTCVHAHLLAGEALLEGRPIGDVYFVSDADPRGLWSMVDGLLAAAGERGPARSVPPWLAYAAGAALEATWFLLRRDDEPPITRFAASQLAHAQWFDVGAARRDLGFSPQVGIDEGLRRVAAWCREADAAPPTR